MLRRGLCVSVCAHACARGEEVWSLRSLDEAAVFSLRCRRKSSHRIFVASQFRRVAVSPCRRVVVS